MYKEIKLGFLASSIALRFSLNSYASGSLLPPSSSGGHLAFHYQLLCLQLHLWYLSSLNFKFNPLRILIDLKLHMFPGLKLNLWAIVRGFPKVPEDPQKCVEEFGIVIQTYQPGFSNLYQLVHLLVIEGQAQDWMRLARRKHPKGI